MKFNLVDWLLAYGECLSLLAFAVFVYFVFQGSFDWLWS